MTRKALPPHRIWTGDLPAQISKLNHMSQHHCLVSVKSRLYNCCTIFLLYLALDVTVNWFCEIHCLALDGFDLNTVHRLSIKEKKSWRSRDSSPGMLGGKQECLLCAMQPSNYLYTKFLPWSLLDQERCDAGPGAVADAYNVLFAMTHSKFHALMFFDLGFSKWHKEDC